MDFSKLSDQQIEIATKVAKEAERQGINPDFVLAMVMQESQFNQGAKSDKGAIGVMQLMPKTAKGLGVDPYDVDENIKGGISYIKQLVKNKNIGNDPIKVLMGYNAGPGTPFLESGNVKDLPEETINHVLKVADFSGGELPTVIFGQDQDKPYTVPELPKASEDNKSVIADQGEKTKDEESYVPLSVPIAGAAGFGLGAGTGTAAGTLKAKADVLARAYEATQPRIEPRLNVPSEALADDLKYGGEKWVKSLTDVDLPGGQMAKADLDLAKGMQAAVGRSGEPGFTGGTIHKGIILSPQTAEKLKPAAAPKVTPKPPSLSPSKLAYVANLLKYPALGGMAGFTVGATGADVYNRLKGKDKTGAAVSGLGGLAGLASLAVPSAGALPSAAIAAPLYNLASDRLKYLEQHPEEYKLQQESFDPMGGYLGPFGR